MAMIQRSSRFIGPHDSTLLAILEVEAITTAVSKYHPRYQRTQIPT